MLFLRLCTIATIVLIASSLALAEHHAPPLREYPDGDRNGHNEYNGPHKKGHKQGRHFTEWLEQLSTEQRVKAEQILHEAQPRLRELRWQLRSKMLEIKAFVYSKEIDPDILPRLGHELQTVRDSLHEELRALRTRLATEAGVTLPAVRGRGCSGLSQQDAAP